MTWFGIALLALTILGLAATGLPAFVVLITVSVFGAIVGILTGAFSIQYVTALPYRLVSLLENDFLQALPLYVLMGALLNRLPVTDSLFRTSLALFPRAKSVPLATGVALGGLLGPMNGSVGASVMALSRSVASHLDRAGVPPATRTAAIVVASTLGIVIPPSLVLILLGDAMLQAHTLAVNATGRLDRVINTQDIFRAALIPGVMFLGLSVAIAWFEGRSIGGTRTRSDEPQEIRFGEVATALATIALVVTLLGGVVLGRFFAVEAAATGAFVLFLAAVMTGRLRFADMQGLLEDVMATAGALFALLVAATTLTLIFRSFGTDRLIGQFIAAIPGGMLGATIVVLAILALSAFALDAFEIIFVIVPITIPPLLIRVPDAVWVSALVLLTLQASFLLPPFGYALIMARTVLKDATSLRATARALLPYLLAQVLVLVAVIAMPWLVHIGTNPADFTRATLPAGAGGPAPGVIVLPDLPPPDPDHGPRF